MYIKLPGGYDLASIDIGTITLEGAVPAELCPTEIGDHDDDGIPDLMVKFDRSTVQALLEPGNNTKLTIMGKWHAVILKGSDTIRVIESGKGQQGNRPEVPPGRSGEHPGKRPGTPPGQGGEHPGQGQGPPTIPPGQGGQPLGQSDGQGNADGNRGQGNGQGNQNGNRGQSGKGNGNGGGNRGQGNAKGKGK